MTKDGVGDSVVIAYLREHARALPKVLGQDDLAWLQARGVREPVMAYLTRKAAVDIGVTGEGRESPAGYPAPMAEIDSSGLGFEYPMDGYASYGGSYLSAPGRLLTRHIPMRRHIFVSPRPMAAPQKLPTPPAVSNTILAPRRSASRRDAD